MEEKPTYEELEYRVRLLEREARWREEAQRTLKEREEYLKVLFEYAPDMYILCDSRARLIDANRAAEKVTGYDRREVVGKDMFEAGIIDGDQFEKAINVLAKVATRVSTEPIEFTIRRKNGTTIDVELRAYPVELQKAPVVLITARDITRYRDKLQRLEVEKRLYLNLFDSDPDPVLVFDEESGRIEAANSAALALFEYSAEEIVRKAIDDLCCPPSADSAPASELRSLLYPLGSRAAFRGFRTKAGQPLPVRVVGTILAAGHRTQVALRILHHKT